MKLRKVVKYKLQINCLNETLINQAILQLWQTKYKIQFVQKDNNMRDQNISQKSNRQKTYTDFNSFNYNHFIDSVSNIQTFQQDYPIGKCINSPENQNTSNKLRKKKSLVKESKRNISHLYQSGKRIQTKEQPQHYSKIYHKKFSEVKQKKYKEFDAINKAFSMFQSQFISFNKLILALKSLGIQIESQPHFQLILSIYNQETNKQDTGIDFESFQKISLKLLKQEKSKDSSDLTHLEKGYYYMIQEASSIKWQSNSQKEESFQSNNFSLFKSHLEQQSWEKRFLTRESLQKLVKYLGIERQINQSDIEGILTFADKQAKGYLTFEDIVTCIQTNRLVQF